MIINCFKNKNVYKNIFQKDENGREINLYKFPDSVFTGYNLFYPNCLLYSGRNLYLPVVEKTMSLNIKSKYETQNMTFNFVKQHYKKRKGSYFFYIYNTDNYFHFLYDSIPYLISYIELKKEIPDIKLLMQYPNAQKLTHCPFVYEMLDLLEIKHIDIEIVNQEFEYENIFVSTSYTHDFDSNLPPRKEIYPFYQNMAKKVQTALKMVTPKYIYISRRTHLHNNVENIGTNYTQRRKLVNEDELVEHLTKKGYVEVFTECLSTLEKIAYFANATHVIGCIGGGIANVLFSNPTTNLIAIISPTFLDVNYRFKYSLNCVNVIYDTNTSHVDTSEFKLYMRVKHKTRNIVGEIIEVKDNSVVIQYTDGSNTGWNSTNVYETIELDFKNIFKLDNGLNSKFKYNLNDLLS